MTVAPEMRRVRFSIDRKVSQPVLYALALTIPPLSIGVHTHALSLSHSDTT